MIQKNGTFRPNSKTVPSAGMRGGLGRTLLTAFLLLSILPLGVISFVAATQARRDLQTELKEKLVNIATLTEAQIAGWVTEQQHALEVFSNSLIIESAKQNIGFSDAEGASAPVTTASVQSLQVSEAASSAIATIFDTVATASTAQDNISAFTALLLFDRQGRFLAAHPSHLQDHTLPEMQQRPIELLKADNSLAQAIAIEPGQPVFALARPVNLPDLRLVALLDPSSLSQRLNTSALSMQDLEIYALLPSGEAFKLYPSAADIDRIDTRIHASGPDARYTATIEAARAGQSGVGSYENHQGVAVVGAYRWLPELNIALLVEQAQASALSASEDLAVALIGATLATVLITALIAAAVTRRITLPIVQLTATAVQIASGDLDQKVPALRRDEIGILARAFNVMTAKLRILYQDLEQKVRERTHQLEEANAEIRYRAMQLAISAEVGRVVTSILDRDLLLSQVVELIRDCFQAYFVAVFFVEERGQCASLHEGSGLLGEQLKASGYRVDVDDNHLVSHAIRAHAAQACVGPSLDQCSDRLHFPHTRAELAVPLKIGGRVIGVLDVHSTHADAFEGDEIMVLEMLSGQVVVALENSRLYETERQAAEQLRESDELRRRFLSNMSRELRMPLNNIIGFSRVILKGIDGPITDLQRQDLEAIHDSGQQLLVLFNDILDIAQIEAGAMELDIRPIDFGEVAHSVIPTVSALLQGRPIEFRYEIPSDLPSVLADQIRLRQVLLKLLSNAAKFTKEGEIQLRVWRDDNQIMASVIDTGIGIPDKDRDKVFEMFQQLSEPIQPSARGTGLGLTLSKEIVEMHGGTIWLESKEGKGTAFTINLPVFEPPVVNQ